MIVLSYFLLMIKQIIFVCSIFSVVLSFPACKKVYYDYMQLALTWPRQYCSQNKCVSNWESSWDGKSFLIHGMWPSSTDLSYLSCFRDNGYDTYCYEQYKFDVNKFSSSEHKELQKYWPKIGAIKNFWGYEWDKHGTCFLNIIKNQEKSQLSKDQIFKRYFMETVNKVKGLDIKLNSGKIDSKTDLADKIGLHSSEFYAMCGRDNQLDEIRICYDIYYDPGQQYVISCPSNSDRNQCKFPMYIK